IDSEQALRDAVRNARTIGYSTGPSGVQLAKLFERWRIGDEIRDRIVHAKPGVPVGSLVANGDVELGFQQLSEVLHVEGIEILGALPAAVQIVTIFSAGLCETAPDPGAVRALLDFLVSAKADDAKRRQGMEPL
ncbi:MAG: substrate-binding domain-containing protein, partial [Casimicrobiaceae bacterium]